MSADYRLQPHVTLAGQAADVRDAIAWVRAHAGEYGADPARCSSPAGVNLAVRAVCESETGIAGLICRYGYYGGLTPRGDMPPMLIVHGEKDMLTSGSNVRAFVGRVRAVSDRRVSYAELPGAHHDFDMFGVHPVRRGQQGSGAVHREGQPFPEGNLQDWQPAQDS